MLAGCDISKYQAPNASGETFQVGKGFHAYDTFDFLYIRAFYGDREDRSVANHSYNCLRANVPYGYYQFWRPGCSVPAPEALGGASLRMALDVESNDKYDPPLTSSSASEIMEYLRQFRAEHGYDPVIYTSQRDWGKLGIPYPTQCPLWVAHWTNAPDPALPAGAEDYAIWQYSNSGGNLDLDRAESLEPFLIPSKSSDTTPDLDGELITLAEAYVKEMVGYAGSAEDTVNLAYETAALVLARRRGE